MTHEKGSNGVEAVLFDTFGTVVDWRTGIVGAFELFASRQGLVMDSVAGAMRWRALYQPAMDAIRSNKRGFVPLDHLHAENLRIVLREQGIDPSQVPDLELTWLNEAWHRLPAWADSVAGLRRLASVVTVGPLSNGNVALLTRLAKTALLPWDVIIGADILGAYKPQPEAYTRAVDLLGLDPHQVMLAAAHNDDLAAARAAGLRTAFLPRVREYGPGQIADLTAEDDWDVIAADIADLAEIICGSMDQWSPERHLLLPPGATGAARHESGSEKSSVR